MSASSSTQADSISAIKAANDALENMVGLVKDLVATKDKTKEKEEVSASSAERRGKPDTMPTPSSSDVELQEQVIGLMGCSVAASIKLQYECGF